MLPGVKRWGLRVLLGGATLYLVCWAATSWWGATAVRREQAARLQEAIRAMPPLVTSLNNGSPHRPTFHIGEPSVPAPAVVVVDYSLPSSGRTARWLWLPWGVYQIDERTTWVE